MGAHSWFAVARVDRDCQPWRTHLIDEVLHRGSTAVVARAGDDLVAITHPSRGLMPGGVTFTDPDAFHTFAAQSTRLPRRALVDALGLADAPVISVDLQVASRAIDVDAACELNRRVASDPVPDPIVRQVRDAAGDLVEASVAGTSLLDAATVHDQVAQLIGLGPGTTPSGDDVIVGVLAGLHAAGHHQAAQLVGQAAVNAMAATTATSQHFLRHAAAGRFAEIVHDALAVIAPTGDQPSGRSHEFDALLTRASSWGAHSGLDLLAGCTAALIHPHPCQEAA